MQRTLALLFVILFFSLSTSFSDASTLPPGVKPTHYEVVITPDAKSLSFQGKTVISIDVFEPTRSITLNAVEIQFDTVELFDVSGQTPFGTPKIKLDKAAETASFSFNQTLTPGHYELALNYSGKISTQAAGLFALDYETAQGQKRSLYTQFENSHARRLIPSWDEPDFKATFTLEAIVPNSEMAISNMPIANKTGLENGLVRVRFEPSPKMSTYLLFFGLGEFDRATTRLGATELGVVTKKGSLAQADYVLSSAQAILAEFNDYFGVPYPLPKLDNIAAPGRSQFFSAMENWGAIFTFEHALLLDPSISTQADKQTAFAIAAHEMAHQWFGNLVTMHWWDDLWLNEGFASWMEGRTTTRLHPEWNTQLGAVPAREHAMQRDALRSTHPVVQHINSVEQAAQAFDEITYRKGEAVIRMLEAYVGADVWRSGVQSYIKKHAFNNTNSDDLWREIEAAAAQPVSAIAHDFTLQSGVPLIRVQDAICADGYTTLRLTQEQFSQDQPQKKSLRWRVPVIAQALGSDTTVRTLVTAGHGRLRVPGCTAVIINAGQSGYYRTLYSPQHFQKIAQSFATLAPIDQLGILSDSGSLGLAGYAPLSSFLDLAAATTIHADPQVWGKITDMYGMINALYRDQAGGQSTRTDQFAKFAIGQLTPVMQQVGWSARAGETSTIVILRNQLIKNLSALGDPVTIAEARQRYAARTTDANALPAALRKTILGVVARHADALNWEQLHSLARAEKTPLIKDQLYALLATSEDQALARRALELALLSEAGATNSAAMIEGVARLHPDLAFDFALAHKEAINDKLDVGSRAQYFPRLAANSIDPTMIAKVNAYAQANLAPSSRRGARKVVAGIAYRIKVCQSKLPQIDAWLARQTRTES